MRSTLLPATDTALARIWPTVHLVIELRADCGSCRALCCVALPFTRSADFAFDKPADVSCRHLDGTACGIHDRLRTDGFPGCAAFDCFGAGQRVTRDYKAGGAAFRTALRLHELLWYLREALTWDVPAGLRSDLQHAWDETLAADPGGDADLDARRAVVAPLLRSASRHVRGADAPDRGGADLVGADLRAVDLRRTDLRGALLIGADLRGADLTHTDLLGADLRGANVRGADLSQALFLTRSQLGATRSDAYTRIPETLMTVPG